MGEVIRLARFRLPEPDGFIGPKHILAGIVSQAAGLRYHPYSDGDCLPVGKLELGGCTWTPSHRDFSSARRHVLFKCNPQDGVLIEEGTELDTTCSLYLRTYKGRDMDPAGHELRYTFHNQQRGRRVDWTVEIRSIVSHGSQEDPLIRRVYDEIFRHYQAHRAVPVG